MIAVWLQDTWTNVYLLFYWVLMSLKSQGDEGDSDSTAQDLIVFEKQFTMRELQVPERTFIAFPKLFFLVP